MAAEIDPTADPVSPRTRVPLKIEEIAMAAGMAAIALITGANVLTRYLTNISLAFTEEYSIALMVFVTIIGAGYAAARGTHIRIAFLVDKLRPESQRKAEIVATSLLAFTFAMLVVFGTRLAWDDYRFEVLTPGLGQPQWLFTACLPLFSIGVVGRAVGRIVRIIRGKPT